MKRFIVEMSRNVTVKQVCREEIDAADEDEVSEIIAETDVEDWGWEDYDVMDTGEMTIHRVTPDGLDYEDDELDDEDEELDDEDGSEDDSNLSKG